ncbi:MAG TPA: glucose-6-phosphate dehydrogenase [Dongiaceae bacterium]|nr:glucose-6-phosphate dehydrogenase [Dongiaceae bacterium]
MSPVAGAPVPAAADEKTASRERPGDPCVFVIFGASGDLVRRKLIPSLYNLDEDGLLPKEFCILGVAREEIDTPAFRERIVESLGEHATRPIDQKRRDHLVARAEFLCGDYADPGTYKAMRDRLAAIDQKYKTGGNYLYYLATPPSLFAPIGHALGAAGLATEEGGRWRRLIVEKPFGEDVESARLLNTELRRDFTESQIYRIDHYLGKETVQNIMVFRFANGIFEPVWNRRYIDHVQITVAESEGVGKRGRYYDTAGAMRDMVPNHLVQLLSFIAMEPPISFEAGAVRDEKAKVLHAVAPMTPEEVLRRTVRGQYGPGKDDGKAAPGYRQEENVAPKSNIETYVAMKLFIDNWRWAGVPFYLRTGKALARRFTEIVIQFHRAPFVPFRDTPVESLRANQLVLNIQPGEGISLRFQAKVPGPVVRMGEVEMDFKYSDHFGAEPSTGYETLLHDCMLADATLFQRDDMVEAGWRIVQPILDVWKALPARSFPNYPFGSLGPKEADELMGRDNRQWRVAAGEGR